MTATAWALVVLALLAVGMCLWAWLTGGPGPDQRHEDVRQRPAAHSRRNREERTQRLRPPAPNWRWLPHPERPGGEAQPLPPPEDLPWPPRRG
jgi:hypothetical protein